MFKRNNKKSDTVEVVTKDYVLYIIMDRKNSNALGYFRSNNIDVTRIFNSISDAKETILLQDKSYKVVLIDSGTGLFNTMNQRKEMIDLFGIADDDSKISIYQTGSLIKAEIDAVGTLNDKSITYHKYNGTQDVLNHLHNNMYILKTERYIPDRVDYQHEKGEQALEYKGYENLNYKQIKNKITELDSIDIDKLINMEDSYKLEKLKAKI